ncbi:hypothetical protein HELRODRAFT_163185 [Helobdella robusta]|uniref:EIF-4F 25 kDa subunit n=1 Tax=Helobdella robusta TaxID=6412 RepID=T1ETS0_HELRO|nr:hypothetical protein HELRODRAFT_163185 [Helobdella robusta]ESN96153.1 hypothetical protein HELRODRAFT_163185 [Helobdella robusta]
MQKTTINGVIKENQELQQSEENTSLISLPGEIYSKHPLEHRWVLWYFKQEKGKDWLEGQKKVAAIDTAEDFWALFNYIQPPSCINVGCDYSFFKDGVQPMWEDASNHRGGRWIINMDKRMRNTELDSFWLETLLAMIGEGFDSYSDEICGAVVNVRMKADKLALWTKNCEDYQATISIGQTFKQRLQIKRDGCLEYQPHHVASNKSNTSMTKSLYGL